MKYGLLPIHFELDNNQDLKIARPVSNTISVIDNWIDMVVFTSIRRFKADEDFGFSFWDNEFIAMNLVDFNNGADYKMVKDKQNDRYHKQQLSLSGINQCEKSVKDSIAFYFPSLKNIQVVVRLSMEKSEFSEKEKGSKYVVRVVVKGKFTPGEYVKAGEENYQRKVEFFMDPFLDSRK